MESKNKVSRKKRKYPPFWDKIIPILIVLIIVIIAVLIIATIRVALGMTAF